MSGRHINDHSFWAGGKSKSSVFPEGVHTKHESSAEGAGRVSSYPDTTEKIRSAQSMTDSKTRKEAMKESYRN